MHKLFLVLTMIFFVSVTSHADPKIQLRNGSYYSGQHHQAMVTYSSSGLAVEVKDGWLSPTSPWQTAWGGWYTPTMDPNAYQFQYAGVVYYSIHVVNNSTFIVTYYPMNWSDVFYHY